MRPDIPGAKPPPFILTRVSSATAGLLTLQTNRTVTTAKRGIVEWVVNTLTVRPIPVSVFEQRRVTTT